MINLTAIVLVLIGLALILIGVYGFKLEGDDTPSLKIGLWNAHKHLKKPGLVFVYFGYAVTLFGILSQI